MVPFLFLRTSDLPAWSSTPPAMARLARAKEGQNPMAIETDTPTDELVFDPGDDVADFELDQDEETDETNGVQPDAEGKESTEDDASKGTETGKPVEVLEGGSVRIGDKEYTPDELTSLIEAGSDRASLDAERKQNEAGIAVADFVRALPAEHRERLFKFAEDLDNEAKTGKPATAASPAVDLGIPEGFKGQTLKWDDMSDEMQAFVAQIAPVINRVQSIDEQLAKHGLQLDAMGKVIPEVQAHVQGTREERAIASATASLKSTLGLDVPAAELQASMKATGIQDPEAAWLKQNARRVLEAGASAKTANRQAKPVDSPNARAKTFDPKGMTADEIFHRQVQGQEMLRGK